MCKGAFSGFVMRSEDCLEWVRWARCDGAKPWKQDLRREVASNEGGRIESL